MNVIEYSTQEFLPTLEAARHGDAAAMDVLFEQFYPRVQRMVHHGLARDLRTNRPWLTARFSTGDVVQEVFRSLLRDLSQFRGNTEDAFTGYLAMVVRNRLVDAIRYHEASRRDGRRTRLELDELVEKESEAPSPATKIARDDELQRYRDALKTLSENQRLLLCARLEQGVEFQDLADQLGYTSKWAARRAFYTAQAALAIRMRRLNEE